MQLARELYDSTLADDSSAAPQVRRDSYVPTSRAQVSRLMVGSPKMQLQPCIAINDRRYLLRGMFVIEFEYEDDVVVARHRTLPVTGYGSTQREAIHSFCEAFDVQWRSLVEVSPDSLTEGGQRRREAMRAAVEDVLAVRTEGATR